MEVRDVLQEDGLCRRPEDAFILQVLHHVKTASIYFGQAYTEKSGLPSGVRGAAAVTFVRETLGLSGLREGSLIATQKRGQRSSDGHCP
jgi:hypothetical protein